MFLSCSAERHALAVLLHQGDEAARRAGLQQERVLQQLGGARPLLGITSQHAAKEVLQHRRHLNTSSTGESPDVLAEPPDLRDALTVSPS